MTSWTHVSLFLGNLCFITCTLSIEFAAETNDGYHIILKWKQRMRGSEQAPYVFLKIQPFSPFSAHFLDLTEDRWAWNNNGDDHGKGKKAPDPFRNLWFFIHGGCAAFFHHSPFTLAKQVTEFLFYWLSLHQFALPEFFFYNVLWPYRLKQRELAGVKYSIIWCCLPGCHPLSILAAYAGVPCEVQSTCLNEYMLYKNISRRLCHRDPW